MEIIGRTNGTRDLNWHCWLGCGEEKGGGCRGAGQAGVHRQREGGSYVCERARPGGMVKTVKKTVSHRLFDMVVKGSRRGRLSQTAGGMGRV